MALAAIRLFNGGAALLAPNFLGHRLGVNTETSPGFGYAFRLFGVRTVLLGVQLFRAKADSPVVREAVAVHGADTLAAIVVLRRHELPPKGAKMAVAASAINVVLAVLAQFEPKRSSTGG
jgi:hypothetical protein